MRSVRRCLAAELRPALVAIGVFAALWTCSIAFAAPAPQQGPQQHTSNAPIEHISQPLILDSGEIRNTSKQRGVAYSTIIGVRNRPWIRLQFDSAALGRTPRGGQPTVLRITSLRDNAVQTMTALHLRQWRNSSAYFNGGMVRLEIICDPAAGPSRVRMSHALVGSNQPRDDGALASICGADDDRALSTEPGVGRLVPGGCTAWIFDDANRTMLTAGHCGTSASTVIEFNVPLSNANGSIVHPGPDDQYAVDPASIQSNDDGVGDDYCYFGCFANTNTSLTPFQAQAAYYALASEPPAVEIPAQDIRISGFGVVSSPVSLTWNQVQKTHTGPYAGVSGSGSDVVNYLTDTTDGNSGSPIIDLDTDTAIGIHTHGGCDEEGGGGFNRGTAIDNPGLQLALANPQGVCMPDPALDFTYPDGLPAYLIPQGDTIRVEVTAGNGGTPEPGTGQLHFDDGAGFVMIAMTEVSPNIYDAIVPATTCGSNLRYYFSAQTTGATTVNNPPNAPSNTPGAYYLAMSVVSESNAFADNFQTDQGWSVSDSMGLSAGTWERGVPIGGGDRNDPATDADASGQCYLSENVDGNSDIDEGSTTLTSPLMDASAPDSYICYSRWFLSNSVTPEDTMLVEVSDDDGASWETLEIDYGTTQAWVRKEWRIEDIAGISPSSQFRIRFTAADDVAGHIVEAGIDGVVMRVLDCGEDCPADINESNAVDINDLLAVIIAWGPCVDPENCPADIDDSDTVNIVDLLAVIINWGACPP